MMRRYLPICLNLEGQAVLLVGGGQVGTQKARDVLGCGARLTVVSPVVTAELEAAAAAGRLALLRRPFAPGDTEGAFLVVAATDDPAANAAVYAEASGAGRLVNVCDDPPQCNYIFPARIERGPLTVAIFTHGTSPAFARRVRREIQAWLGPEYGALAELLAELRPRVRAVARLTQPERQRVYERIVYSEALLLFREGRVEEARLLAESVLDELLGASHPPGAAG